VNNKNWKLKGKTNTHGGKEGTGTKGAQRGLTSEQGGLMVMARRRMKRLKRWKRKGMAKMEEKEC
jgi:hypothetical protein